jgi:hypothetical protein
MEATQDIDILGKIFKSRLFHKGIGLNCEANIILRLNVT